MNVSFLAIVAAASLGFSGAMPVSIGPRPYWLIDQMREGPLKSQLELCATELDTMVVSDWSIGHRGAPMQFPEHTLESYKAAAIMGAGIIECDVTFTSDRQLICRHAQCDLHTTTDVVTRPELNAKCTKPWEPMQGEDPLCCASDFTLEEIKTLCAKMDSSFMINATIPEDYAFGGTADWRTDLYSTAESCPSVPTHMESIELISEFGAYFTPELKSPEVEMPYEGDYSQEDYAQQMIDEYIQAGIPPEQVWPQSFNPTDVVYWVENTDYGAQAVALDELYIEEDEIDTWLDFLVENNVQIVAPPMQRLVQAAPNTTLLMEQGYYATAAQERGLGIIAWTLERAGPGLGGFYWETTEGIVDLEEGDRFSILHVLYQDVGILGIFSDWPATSTFYANCFNIGLRTRTGEAVSRQGLDFPTEESADP